MKLAAERNDNSGVGEYSVGVMTDVRGGGLKQDLSLMFEMGGATANTLPSEFSGKKLYQSTHEITGISDPNWSALAGYYNSFHSLTNAETNPTFAVKPGAASVTEVPVEYNPAPVFAKVETIFSLVARPKTDCHWFPTDAKYQPYLRIELQGDTPRPLSLQRFTVFGDE